MELAERKQDMADNEKKKTTQNPMENVAQGDGAHSNEDELSESFQGQNSTRTERPMNMNNAGHGSHAVGAQNTGKEGNLGGRNPGQNTVSGDRDATRGRGESVSDPMTSRDPAINKNSDSK
jgi:hypothetical protein